jgi:hypothetical protein
MIHIASGSGTPSKETSTGAAAAVDHAALYSARGGGLTPGPASGCAHDQALQSGQGRPDWPARFSEAGVDRSWLSIRRQWHTPPITGLVAGGLRLEHLQAGQIHVERLHGFASM